MKIFINKLNESWIVDRFRHEWYEHNKDISMANIKKSEIVWIIAPWTWRKISKKQLKRKIVVCTIHHLNHEFLNANGYKEFLKRDYYVDYYHVITEKSKEELQKLTNKKIFVAEFWLNQNHFFEISNKQDLRKKYGFSEKDYLIGSFQRDTEGSDLKSPKLVKGPDIFIDILKQNFIDNKNLKVILTGKRRNYMISELNKLKIKYEYFEMTNFDKLNELYNILDLYIVSSRKEGGPQQILEAAITKTPILSTNVGLADKFLAPESIYTPNTFKKSKTNTDYPYKQIERLKIPLGFDPFLSIFQKVLNEN